MFQKTGKQRTIISSYVVARSRLRRSTLLKTPNNYEQLKTTSGQKCKSIKIFKHIATNNFFFKLIFLVFLVIWVTNQHFSISATNRKKNRGKLFHLCAFLGYPLCGWVIATNNDKPCKPEESPLLLFSARLCGYVFCCCISCWFAVGLVVFAMQSLFFCVCCFCNRFCDYFHLLEGACRLCVFVEYVCVFVVLVGI